MERMQQQQQQQNETCESASRPVLLLKDFPHTRMSVSPVETIFKNINLRCLESVPQSFCLIEPIEPR
jgi:hypothetical protein